MGECQFGVVLTLLGEELHRWAQARRLQGLSALACDDLLAGFLHPRLQSPWEGACVGVLAFHWVRYWHCGGGRSPNFPPLRPAPRDPRHHLAVTSRPGTHGAPRGGLTAFGPRGAAQEAREHGEQHFASSQDPARPACQACCRWASRPMLRQGDLPGLTSRVLGPPAAHVNLCPPFVCPRLAAPPACRCRCCWHDELGPRPGEPRAQHMEHKGPWGPRGHACKTGPGRGSGSRRQTCL